MSPSHRNRLSISVGNASDLPRPKDTNIAGVDQSRASTEPPPETPDSATWEEKYGSSPLSGNGLVEFRQGSPDPRKVLTPIPQSPIPTSPLIQIAYPTLKKSASSHGIVNPGPFIPVGQIEAETKLKIKKFFEETLTHLKNSENKTNIDEKEKFLALANTLSEKWLKDKLASRVKQLIALDALLNEFRQYEVQIQTAKQTSREIYASSLKQLNRLYQDAHVSTQLASTMKEFKEKIKESRKLFAKTQKLLDTFARYSKTKTHKAHHEKITLAAREVASEIIKKNQADEQFTSLMKNTIMLFDTKKKLAPIQRAMQANRISSREKKEGENLKNTLQITAKDTAALCKKTNNSVKNKLTGAIFAFIGALSCITIVGLIPGIKLLKSAKHRFFSSKDHLANQVLHFNQNPNEPAREQNDHRNYETIHNFAKTIKIAHEEKKIARTNDPYLKKRML